MKNTYGTAHGTIHVFDGAESRDNWLGENPNRAAIGSGEARRTATMYGRAIIHGPRTVIPRSWSSCHHVWDYRQDSPDTWEAYTC